MGLMVISIQRILKVKFFLSILLIWFNKIIKLGCILGIYAKNLVKKSSDPTLKIIVHLLIYL